MESAARGEPCGEPAISLHFHHVSLVQWTTRLLPIMRNPGSIPRGGTYVKPGFLLLALSGYITLFRLHVVLNLKKHPTTPKTKKMMYTINVHHNKRKLFDH
jgi:hypothetical protein